jgi:hypothetical protein
MIDRPSDAHDPPSDAASPSRVDERLDAARAHIHTRIVEQATTLTQADFYVLHAAFHRAESLAEMALRTARAQLSPAFHAELDEQIADELRHVDTFDRWLPPGAREPIPRVAKQRPEAIWFAVLLINEIAGFCQFEMLAALDPDDDRKAKVRAISADERRHIARLVRWLAPVRGRPMAGEIQKIARTFQRQIDVRMRQFLPREALSDLRDVVGGAIVDVIDALVVRTLAPMGFVPFAQLNR